MSTPTVTVERRDRTTVITLARPERRNAVDAATAAALVAAFRAFDADGESDVLVLTGAGGAFCSGAATCASPAAVRTSACSTGVSASR